MFLLAPCSDRLSVYSTMRTNKKYQQSPTGHLFESPPRRKAPASLTRHCPLCAAFRSAPLLRSCCYEYRDRQGGNCFRLGHWAQKTWGRGPCRALGPRNQEPTVRCTSNFYVGTRARAKVAEKAVEGPSRELISKPWRAGCI